MNRIETADLEREFMRPSTLWLVVLPILGAQLSAAWLLTPTVGNPVVEGLALTFFIALAIAGFTARRRLRTK
jgi:hypothetical protein